MKESVRLSKHAMRTTLVLASQDRQARHNRNDPSNPSQRQDLTRWDDKGGIPIRSPFQCAVFIAA